MKFLVEGSPMNRQVEFSKDDIATNPMHALDEGSKEFRSDEKAQSELRTRTQEVPRYRVGFHKPRPPPAPGLVLCRTQHPELPVSTLTYQRFEIITSATKKLSFTFSHDISHHLVPLPNALSHISSRGIHSTPLLLSTVDVVNFVPECSLEFLSLSYQIASDYGSFHFPHLRVVKTSSARYCYGFGVNWE
ncbi:uncharacterized protein BDR25DRAFT_360293 [Lindgomyces ingoldianus]|uniref:Uncharacterized protein n=1 Tax=Lindgomyces ingoldianus TaxID=673940 RepID=A0ACB6QFM6_9PLEO|nr:uncharacterized protein BDR25DRAFT_360293 [Lindgomyces ingoldianus]KAF2465768.1 hypothetical protein BDR25DRAFT_360293 [Lindgomyces ingoldianus]